MQFRRHAGVGARALTVLCALGMAAVSCGGRSHTAPEQDTTSSNVQDGGPEAAADSAGGGAGDATAAADGGSVDATIEPDAATSGPDAATIAPDAEGTSPPAVGGDGYLTLDAGPYALAGYVSSSAGGSSSSISLTYGPTSFCASGVVGANATYNSWATAGFNLDQTQGSQATAKTLPLWATSITVAFSNQGGSPLRIQLIDPSSNYWCYTLTGVASPVTIPLSSFNTQCWDNSGQAFTPGTPVLAIELNVPGSNTEDIPYAFCFFGLTIQPLADAGPASDAEVADDAGAAGDAGAADDAGAAGDAGAADDADAIAGQARN